MHLDQSAAAIEIFRGIERDHPGMYTPPRILEQPTSSTETWRKRSGGSVGIRRNPNAHEGTEWLHVRILLAKIALRSDPNWLRRHSVSGAEFGRFFWIASPRIARTETGRELTLSDLQHALEYQLRERMQFVRPLAAPPADTAVVADLLYDLGNALALTTSVQHAMAVYEESNRYAMLPRPIESRPRFCSFIGTLGYILDYWIAISLLLALPVLIALRRWQKRRAARRKLGVARADIAVTPATTTSP